MKEKKTADTFSQQKAKSNYDLERHRKTFKPLSDDRDARAAELEKILKDRDKKRYEPELDIASQSYTRPQVNSSNPLEMKEGEWDYREKVNESGNHGSDDDDGPTASSSDWEEVESLSDPRYAPAPWV